MNTYINENAEISKRIKENPSETINWLNENQGRRYKSEKGYYEVKWQQCEKLGGYCTNDNGHEDQSAERKWKSFDDEQGEKEYFNHLAQQARRTQKVDCTCRWVKDGEQRSVTYRRKGMRKWDSDSYSKYCEKHARERAENLKSKLRIELRNEPMWAENWTILGEKQKQAESR